MRFWGTLALFVLIVYSFGILRIALPSCLSECYAYITHIFFSSYIAAWILQLTKEMLFTSKINIRNKAVLITGCDTGFGNFLAKRLDKKGFTVFACCLDSSSEGARNLKDTCSQKLQIVQLDVTSDTSVDRALETVSQNLNDEKLWAIVNNAGVLRGFQTELTPMKDYDDCMQVNALGMVRVTQTFLPLLRKSRGRVINLCSEAGRLYSPFLGAYAMSKHAAVSFTENIMYELREFGVRVISVEPEFFKTPMCNSTYMDKACDASLEKIAEDIKNDYGEKYITSGKKFLFALTDSSCPNIEYVINALEDATTLRYPPDIYKPCRNSWAKLILFFGERVPREIYDLALIVLKYALGVRPAKTGKDYITQIFNI